MAYIYEENIGHTYTDKGQRQFLRIRDRVHRLLREAGAVRMQEAMSGEAGDLWEIMACVDRLVALGEIGEIDQARRPPGQFRIFVKVGE